MVGCGEESSCMETAKHAMEMGQVQAKRIRHLLLRESNRERIPPRQPQYPEPLIQVDEQKCDPLFGITCTDIRQPLVQNAPFAQKHLDNFERVSGTLGYQIQNSLRIPNPVANLRRCLNRICHGVHCESFQPEDIPREQYAENLPPTICQQAIAYRPTFRDPEQRRGAYVCFQQDAVARCSTRLATQFIQKAHHPVIQKSESLRALSNSAIASPGLHVLRECMYGHTLTQNRGTNFLRCFTEPRECGQMVCPNDKDVLREGDSNASPLSRR
jgi:hypothetical protein